MNVGGGVEAEPRDDVEEVGDGAPVGERGRLLDLGIFMSVSYGDTETDWDLALSITLSFLPLSTRFSFFARSFPFSKRKTVMGAFHLPPCLSQRTVSFVFALL